MFSNKKEDNKCDNQNESIYEVITKPYNHVLLANDKNIHSKLIKAINEWLCISDEKLAIICEITETLHNASLMIDDIKDNSMKRRDIPASHQVFGIPSTLNAANYAVFCALDTIGGKLCDLSAEKDRLIYLEASKIFCEQLLQLHRGQSLDIYWREFFVCPTEQQYVDMVDKKIAGLLGLSIRLMQLYSDKKTHHYLDIVKKISLYFQIRDDYINLKPIEYHKEIGFAKDLSSGKLTFPIINAIESLSDDHRFIDILREKPKDEKTKRYAIKLMEECGSFKYTLNFIKQLNQQIRIDAQKLGSNQSIIELMDYLNVPED